MRIFHFIYDHGNNPWVGGGGAVRAYEINRRLSKRHQITVISGKFPGARDYKDGNLSYVFVGTDRNSYILSTFCYAVAANRFLRIYEKNADMVIEDFAPYNPLFSQFIINKPLIIQVHHREGINLLKRYFVFGIPFFLIERFYPQTFRNILCVSEASKKKFAFLNATIISNGVKESLLNAEPAAAEYLSFLGRLHIHNKGLDTLLMAMTEVDGKLIIAGKGRDRDKLMQNVVTLGLEKKVEIKGYISDKEKEGFLGDSSIFILPSRYEGQGIVVLEAAAYGKPVIVSDIPELRYAVDGGFGISFKTGDADDLASKIKLLTGNESMRKEMGQRAREYAKQYTWDQIAEQYEAYLVRIKEMRQ